MMRKPLYAALFAAAASATLLTAGCGGVSTNNSTLRPTPSSGPVIFGINPVALLNTGAYVEESGLTSATAISVGTQSVLPGYSTAETAYNLTAGNGPLPSEQTSTGGIPGGFQAGGVSVPAAGPAPNQPVIFRAAISNGTNGKTGQVLAITPSSVVLTSPEIASFTQPLTFTGVIAGTPYPNGTYATAAFPLPFTTTGLHKFTAAVADAGGNASNTTFEVPVLRASDSGVLVQIVDANGTVPGATAIITNPLTGATSQATADSNGVIILFAAPGAQTVTVAGPTGSTEAGTDTETLVAGQLFSQVATQTSSGTTYAPYTITIK